MTKKQNNKTAPQTAESFGSGKGRRLDPEMHAERVRLYAEGLTDQQIAEKVGRTKASIAQWRGKYSLPQNRPETRELTLDELLNMAGVDASKSEEILSRQSEYRTRQEARAARAAQNS